ncbi:hypothetical protein ACVWZZ_007206 [Bradyrhizobium sp. LM6.10]
MAKEFLSEFRPVEVNLASEQTCLSIASPSSRPTASMRNFPLSAHTHHCRVRASETTTSGLKRSRWLIWTTPSLGTMPMNKGRTLIEGAKATIDLNSRRMPTRALGKYRLPTSQIAFNICCNQEMIYVQELEQASFPAVEDRRKEGDHAGNHLTC